MSRKESWKIEEHYKFVTPALASPSSGETKFRHGNESLPCLRGMPSDSNAAAVRSAGCSWTAWRDAQDVGGFEMFAGRSRMGRPNIAVLMVRDAQCVRLPKAASICVTSMRTSESKEHWQLYICSAVPATWCGFGIWKLQACSHGQQDFASNLTYSASRS